ncbi:DNA methyltransferase [Chloroflexota bacterium]
MQPISFVAAKKILVRHHYLHSFPGGTKLAFGTFAEGKLLGAITFGSGPQNAYQLVASATPEDCLTLSRLWLSDELLPNSESRVIGICLRALKKHTSVKFLISYADPSQGHLGTIYQATGWTYIGLSEAMPMFDLGDKRLCHSRSLSHAYGSHSVKHFESCGVKIKVVPQPRKHRYIYFLDRSCKERLTVSIRPYPRKITYESD